MQQPPPSPPLPPPPGPGTPYGYAQPVAFGQYAYGQPQGYPPPRRGRRWWLWGCGGCAVILLILFVVGAAIGISTFTGSPLRHFPAEAGATTVRDTFQVINGHSGETLVIDDPHALGDVEAYYQSQLHSNGWTVDATDLSKATSGDAWHFSRSGSSTQAGMISFLTRGKVTEITVQYVY